MGTVVMLDYVNIKSIFILNVQHIILHNFYFNTYYYSHIYRFIKYVNRVKRSD